MGSVAPTDVSSAGRNKVTCKSTLQNGGVMIENNTLVKDTVPDAIANDNKLVPLNDTIPQDIMMGDVVFVGGITRRPEPSAWQKIVNWLQFWK